MSEVPDSPDELEAAAQAFNAALDRLEQVLSAAVGDVADLARRTGYADGHAAGLGQGLADGHARGLAEGLASGAQAPAGDPQAAAELEQALEAARRRNAELDRAVAGARTALDAAIDDIRGVLGSV